MPEIGFAVGLDDEQRRVHGAGERAPVVERVRRIREHHVDGGRVRHPPEDVAPHDGRVRAAEVGRGEIVLDRPDRGGGVVDERDMARTA
jgi:hypothetical protein